MLNFALMNTVRVRGLVHEYMHNRGCLPAALAGAYSQFNKS